MAEVVTMDAYKDILEKFRLNTPRVMRAIAKRGAAFIAREATSNVNDDLLMKRTGGLMRYIGASLKVQKEETGSITIGLPAGDPLAIIGRVQDSGAHITAKNGAMLRIPLPPALTGAGVLKAPLGEVGFSVRGAMAPGTNKKFFLLPNHNLIGINRGEVGVKGGGFEAWFSLQPFIDLKPRGWFSGAVVFYRQNRDREVCVVIQKFLRSGGEVDDAVQP